MDNERTKHKAKSTSHKTHIEERTKQTTSCEFPGWLCSVGNNPTDANVFIFSNQPPDGSLEYSKKRLEGISKQALETGHIRLINLVYISAKEESYNEVLSELWELSGFNSVPAKDPEIVFP
ncbi:MAG: hypothetical protein JRI81_12035 [Deltaproteobacteria bacterium]|nr:hypothetical protein [Deltaproteobacteria bacterium]